VFRKPEAPEPTPPPARRFTDRQGDATVILPGLAIDGDIEGEDSVDIAGRVHGNVRIGGLCRVRETGRVEGDIRARQVLIEGEVEGRRITAAEKLELGARARVRADLEAGTVALADGCRFHGSVRMGGEGGAVTFTEKRAGEPR